MKPGNLVHRPLVEINAFDLGDPGVLSEGGCAGEAEEDGVVELGPLAAGLAAVHTLRVAFDLK